MTSKRFIYIPFVLSQLRNREMAIQLEIDSRPASREQSSAPIAFGGRREKNFTDVITYYGSLIRSSCGQLQFESS